MLRATRMKIAIGHFVAPALALMLVACNGKTDLSLTNSAVTNTPSASHRHGNDPELFAGLVHACRYCGLFDQSIAAHREARRLDPTAATSVEETLLLTGDLVRLLATEHPGMSSGDDTIRAIAVGLAGRRGEAREMVRAIASRAELPLFLSWSQALMAWLEGRPEDFAEALAAIGGFKVADDPEAMFQQGWLWCDMGEPRPGLERLEEAIAAGYCVAPTLAASPSFDGLRESPAFQALCARAEAGRQEALRVFREAGGERLLGR
jgi:hypothetical protein